MTLDPRTRNITAVLPTNRLVDRSNTAVTPSADSQLAATAPADFGGAQIAFMNRGGVRRPGFTFAGSAAGNGNGNVTYGEAFTVQPFGNSLVTMALTAQDLKHVLEQRFAGCRGQGAATTRIMVPSAGLGYTSDGAQACDARIRNLSLTLGGVTESIGNASLAPGPGARAGALRGSLQLIRAD